MPLTIHPNIASLVPYVPGKPLADVERDLGIHGAIKLASNENPLGPSTKAVAAVQRHPRVAARTFRDPAAIVALQHRCIAAAVQEQQDLRAGVEMVVHALEQRVGQAGPQAPAAHVEQRHRRVYGGAGAFRQVQRAVAAGLRVVQRLQRRRGRTQHHRHVEVARTPDSEVARGVAETLLLLKGRIVLFINNNGAKALKGSPDCGTGTNNHSRSPFTLFTGATLDLNGGAFMR
jgi:hypothetical protein